MNKSEKLLKCLPMFGLFRDFYKYKRKLISCIKLSTNNHRSVTSKTGCENGVNKLKILFFGTDSFSLPSLQKLHKEGELPALGVVTSFKSPKNCVRTYAEQHQITLHRWPVEPVICERYDLGVVVSFGHLIPEQIIKSFPLGMINVHASLLPRWRGAAPIAYAIMHGEKETGVSIMRIEPKHFDIGDILAQQRVPINQHMFMPELHALLANDGASLLSKVIKEYPASFQKTIKQNNAFATLAPKITSAITELNWSTVSAVDVYNRYRALYGYKNLSTKFQGKNVQLMELKLATDTLIPGSNSELKNTAGRFTYKRDRKCLVVSCGDESYIEVYKLRIEGKKVMSAVDFNNGFLNKSGSQEFLFTTK